ncbi:LamG-like jellyroll fold domain-containing protein [Microbacterium sp. SSW1-59]|uniref:LamG-like jellyroll fold domain-containing protein n=1 Tax=Microbacterium xanthum TaxID=3079794 RepID=UPI002AD2C50F|nr:LamG-like jellyroll fold domain-containing protein [Microbacterium sp. SSW1-59]MDZ8201755.1 LamG-like jellyroll fold domain-containing protein [Microbacterium sp. SSW1-59]
MHSRFRSRTRVRGILASCLTLGLAAGTIATTAAPAVAETTDDDLGSRFTLAVLPDTQFYSRYDDALQSQWGANPFDVQTQWLAEHRHTLNIPFVTHLGDVVDRAGVQSEWMVADGAMETLEDAGLPYSILAGNHDVNNSDDSLDDTDYDLGAEPYLTWFGPERAADQATFGGRDDTGMSEFHVFEAEGQQFLVLALSWRISTQTQQWAQDVMDAHPTLPVILTTHSLLAVESDQVSPLETEYGLELWENLIRSNDQIFLTMNGHSHGATVLEKTNDAGHAVTQILIDYQMAADGGNGYLGLYEFDLTNNRINVQTASPWIVSKPADRLQAYDQPLLESGTQQFTIEIDFAERFSGFTDSFTAGSADEPSLSAAARDILLDGFEGPDPITTALPGDERDFVAVEGTLAHWRFNGAEGIADADAVFEDIAGDNDLRRVDPAATSAEGAIWEDVTIQSDDVHGFSSDGAAACFDASSGARYSYLSTAQDAPLNDVVLSDGYTIETFVKMDADWDAADNQWSKFLTRTGNRSTIDGVPWSRWDYTASPTALGISNLREFQYTSIPAETTKGDKTNWSGEIMVDTWTHIALVNDPEAMTTTLYVDGAPVLRNAVDTVGMAFNEGMPWILGADWVDDAARNGWHGCIGETRIIDHPTTPEQWLTQRADLSDLQLGTAPEGELPAGTETATFRGTGLAGADVHLTSLITGSGMARTAVDLAGASTVVNADGTWEIVVDSGLDAGTHTVSLTQALGSRQSEPVIVTFSIAEAAAPTPDPTDSAEPTSGPEAPAEGDAAGAGDAQDLAVTGFDATGLVALGAAALVAAVAGFALLIARRRAARA